VHLVTMILGTGSLRWEMISDGDFAGSLILYFFVTFDGGTRDLIFDVFNDLNYCVHDGGKIVPQGTTKCIWDVRYDGIYLGYVDGDKTYSQKYRDW